MSHARLLAWFRSDDRRRILGIFAVAAAILTVGALALASAFFLRDHLTPGLALAFACVGAAATVAGPLFAVVSLHRVMAAELSLLVRDDGIVVVRDDREELLSWDEIESARDDERGRLLLLRRDAEPLTIERRFADIDARQLARRLNHLRSKALLGI
ncbi:MAG: hypothetical protein KC503_27080 [Myxococcales bacterium]|nr:hypothetical protein [Myxococcales bacterium]